MNKECRAYRRLYYFLRVILFPFFRVKYIGRENIQPGAAVFCANHSSNLDPIFQAIASGIDTHLHFMAKAELFRIPLLSRVLRSIGSFPVERGQNDTGAIKTSLRYLKSGEKISIFPEGTRFRTDETGNVKSGALRIADQMSVPVVPVYIPRNKGMFRSCTIVIGTPYLVNPEKTKLSFDDYKTLAEELMMKISALKKVADEAK